VASSLPGSAPELVYAAARDLRANASVLRAVLERVRRLGQEQAFWTGSAADQFAQTVANAPKHIDAVCSRYEGYAVILEDYAAILVHVRAGIPRRQRQLDEAGRRLNPCGTAAEQQLARDGALAVYESLRGEYEALHTAAETAARRLHRLDDASALQNPQGWHALANSASSAFNTLAQFSVYAGLLAIVICPAAAPIFFAAAAAFSAAQLATDVVRSTTLGEQVSLTRFADATIGVVPFTGLAKAGVEGVQAARAAEGVGSSAARAGSAALKSIATGPATEAREGIRGLSQLDGRQMLSLGDRAISLGIYTEDALSTAYQMVNGNSPLTDAARGVTAGIAVLSSDRRRSTGDRMPVAVNVGDGPGSRRVTIVIPAVLPSAPGLAT
jgi:uncharacterized protein YukE